MSLVLASSSIYRQQLLEKLNIPFSCQSADIDETRHPGELPESLVDRLSYTKARTVAVMTPDSFIIGSDQVASLDGDIITKPESHEHAVEQLLRASGNRVVFHTGLCLYDSNTQHAQRWVEPFTVHFDALDQRRIEQYLAIEQPYDCAGSFKSEGLGITLFKRLEGDDPNTLIGLPLIKLTNMLRTWGIDPLDPD
ncbi:Maf family nucleotide pyrophosphatase [bacterium]|nr:Maf family nucleotide pyrophosphatase [bacterium]